ncbi:FAD-dependent oxidoreductase [bacterium]|nr:FAD-dependent oxidoreductase [bacterium]NCQ55166.1 FAD-dependent oxidoreductase [Candidatus Parcubacteria bacterium]NCS67321.1 FAD-dependent oxidoreductase [Candidatus Peregrinibacteria bacterium]NCS96576.1 FAD-dependent oxidoreductase [bacterium]
MNTILTGELVLVSKEIAATDTLKLNFSLSNLKTLTGENYEGAFNFSAGQFVSLGFSQTAWRAYSIASTPDEKTLELMVRIVAGGVGSEALNAAEIGDAFPFKGPFGHFTLSENTQAHLVFCATGTGIAPFRAMIKTEAARDTPRAMTLLYGGQNADDLAYLEEVNQWGAELKVQLGLSRDANLKIPAGLKCEAMNCRITNILESFEKNDDFEFYLCGNGAMVKSVQEILQEKGFAKEQIFMERFN